MPSQLSDPVRWVDDHGDYLFKFALARLRDVARAEDMVQETFLAELKGGDKFAGRSAERSWLVGILKNKISDYFRKASRETSFTDLESYVGEERHKFISEGPFQGGWIHELGPLEWSSDEPGVGLDSSAFGKRSTIAPTNCRKTSRVSSPCARSTVWGARRFAIC